MQNQMDSALAGLGGCVGIVVFGLLLVAIVALARWLPALEGVLP